MTEDPEQQQFSCESPCLDEVGMMLSAGFTLSVCVCVRERGEARRQSGVQLQCSAVDIQTAVGTFLWLQLPRSSVVLANGS